MKIHFYAVVKPGQTYYLKAFYRAIVQFLYPKARKPANILLYLCIFL